MAGQEALAQQLLKIFGEKKASWALMLTGFIVAIPVFFDVAFITSGAFWFMHMQRKTKKSLLLYGYPIISGSSDVPIAFIPPYSWSSLPWLIY